jgi:elongation factor P hydroxylase
VKASRLERSGEHFCASRLERVFALCFEQRFRTLLCGGHSEPLYLPEDEDGTPARIAYRADYFASALHEVAHWCIAGADRRLLEDYGYWYTPDGRDARAQLAFESVEYKPQALEWIFARACGHGFKISLDNLDLGAGQLPGGERFEQRVHAQVLQWQREGLPSRAAYFFVALQREFDEQGGSGIALSSFDFSLAELNG